MASFRHMSRCFSSTGLHVEQGWDPDCFAEASSAREVRGLTSAPGPRVTTSGLVRAARSASASRGRTSGSMARTPNRTPSLQVQLGSRALRFAQHTSTLTEPGRYPRRRAARATTQQERRLPVNESLHRQTARRTVRVNAHTRFPAATRILLIRASALPCANSANAADVVTAIGPSDLVSPSLSVTQVAASAARLTGGPRNASDAGLERSRFRVSLRPSQRRFIRSAGRGRMERQLTCGVGVATRGLTRGRPPDGRCPRMCGNRRSALAP
jgi:hypothetical protein